MAPYLLMSIIFICIPFEFGANKIDIATSLDEVNDDELIQLLRSQKYVLVLFATENCKLCDKYEKVLLEKKSDIINALEPETVSVVKSILSQLLRFYNPNIEPSLIYFRHGIPLLYDGPIETDALYYTVTENKEPCVRILNDNSFEHLTQASSGATTGDWLIFFHATTNCIDCPRLIARVEAVCVKLKNRINVASVNKQNMALYTFKRFLINNVPEFIFFRHGNMYRYTSKNYDITSLTSFASETYKNMESEVVPPPLESDIAYMRTLRSIAEASSIIKYLSFFFCICLIVTLTYKIHVKQAQQSFSVSLPSSEHYTLKSNLKLTMVERPKSFNGKNSSLK